MKLHYVEHKAWRKQSTRTPMSILKTRTKKKHIVVCANTSVSDTPYAKHPHKRIAKPKQTWPSFLSTNHATKKTSVPVPNHEKRNHPINQLSILRPPPVFQSSYSKIIQISEAKIPSIWRRPSNLQRYQHVSANHEKQNRCASITLTSCHAEALTQRPSRSLECLTAAAWRIAWKQAVQFFLL